MEIKITGNREPRENGMHPDLIVIHATASSTLKGTCDWFLNPRSFVSAHYVTDKDGHTVRMVNSEDAAWHAGRSNWNRLETRGGSLNWRSIGYELVNLNTGRDPYPEAQIAALVEWVAYECKKWGIPADRLHIVGHHEIAQLRKTDPKGLNLDVVVDRVRQALAQEGLTIVSAPRISLETFTDVLNAGKSPAAPVSGELYAICVQMGVDPAVALAFFAHESRLGTAGVTRSYSTKNWGNVRTPEDPELGVTVIIPNRGNFVRYPTWQNGLLDWCKRLRGPKYAGCGLTTVELVIPKYAPSSDGNDPQRYIDVVRGLVAKWAAAPGTTYWVRILVDALRIREGAATTYPIVATLGRGTLVECDGTKDEGQGPWHHKHDGQGFFSADQKYSVRV